MLLDDRQPALINELVKPGRTRRAGACRCIQAAFDLRLAEQIIEIDPRLGRCQGYCRLDRAMAIGGRIEADRSMLSLPCYGIKSAIIVPILARHL